MREGLQLASLAWEVEGGNEVGVDVVEEVVEVGRKGEVGGVVVSGSRGKEGGWCKSSGGSRGSRGEE